MLCDRCKERDAKILYTEIINGVKKEQHLCEECATEYTSFHMEKPLLNSDLSLGDLLSTILSGFTEEEKKKAYIPVTCSNCGTTYDDFLRIGRFGCYKCYSNFDMDGQLGRTLNSIQGAKIHTGKRPIGYSSADSENSKKISEVEKLTIKLQEAIEKEEFEEAARLRDIIKDLKKEEGAGNA